MIKIIIAMVVGILIGGVLLGVLIDFEIVGTQELKKLYYQLGRGIGKALEGVSLSEGGER